MCLRSVVFGLMLSAVALAEAPQFTVAGLRVVPDRWDKESNFHKLDYFARQAAAKGAQLVITPEGFLDGYVGNDRPLDKSKYSEIAESIDGPMMRRVQNLARELKIYLAMGFPEKRGDLIFNSVVIFGPDGGVVSRYSKTHCGGEPHNTEGAEF